MSFNCEHPRPDADRGGRDGTTSTTQKATLNKTSSILVPHEAHDCPGRDHPPRADEENDEKV